MCINALGVHLQVSTHTVSCMAKKPQLPINLYFCTQSGYINATTSIKFLQQLHERLGWAYKTFQQVIESEKKGYMQNYNHKVKCTQLHVGDLALLKRIILRVNIRSKTMERRPFIKLRGSHMLGCQFSERL